jgi:hypothetical protein
VGYNKWKSQQVVSVLKLCLTSQHKNLVRTYQQNVLHRLQEPFVPPIQPDWGPVFYRGAWEDHFREACRKKMYTIYYGPSELGKSVAVTHALSGKMGVIYVRLRQLQPDRVASRFASAVGLYGENRSGMILLLLVLTDL